MTVRAIGFALAIVLATAGSASAQFRAPDIVISPDDRFVYVGGNATRTYERDRATGELTLIDEGAPPTRALTMTPDGRHLYGVLRDALHILSRDSATGLLTHEATIDSTARINAWAVAPDGRQLYGADAGGDAIVTFERDAGTGGLRRTGGVYGGKAPGEVPWLDAPSDLAVSPDGANVYVAAGGVGMLARDPGTGALFAGEHLQSQGGTNGGVAVSADGHRVYAGGGDMWALERDPDGGRLTALNGVLSPCNQAFCNQGWSIAPSPDGSIVMSTRQLEQSLMQVRAVPEGIVREADYVEGQDGVHGLVNPLVLKWSHDGRFLYVGVYRNQWFESGEYYITGADALTSIAVFRRDPGVARLQPAGVTEIGRLTRTSGPPTVTINDGALFTRSPHVTLTITGFGYSVRLSNDGTLGGPARRFRSGDRHAWTLEDTGLGRDVRRVFVAYTPLEPGAAPRVVSDDIVLDQRPPALISARGRRTGRRSARFVLRARDNRSGVRKVQITARRARPGKRLAFKRHLVLRRRMRPRAWVRVFDGAGNPSRWRHVRLTHQSTG